MNDRILSQFNCGAASAVATKLALAEYGDRVRIVNAFVAEEDDDNRRFLADCEFWFGRKVTVLRNDKYNASTHEVWRKKRYIKGLLGAPCSKELKRDLLDAFSLPNDIFVLGYTADEPHRLSDFMDANNGRKVLCPLIDKGITHEDCLGIVDRAGIVLPLMYRKGYNNANCKGCPKGGQNYWQHIRKDFPDEFVKIQAIQETIGPGAYFLRFRSGSRKGERMSLADLPTGLGNMADEPTFSCGVTCELTASDLA